MVGDELQTDLYAVLVVLAWLKMFYFVQASVSTMGGLTRIVIHICGTVVKSFLGIVAILFLGIWSLMIWGPKNVPHRFRDGFLRAVQRRLAEV